MSIDPRELGPDRFFDADDLCPECSYELKGVLRGALCPDCGFQTSSFTRAEQTRRPAPAKAPVLPRGTPRRNQPADPAPLVQSTAHSSAPGAVVTEDRPCVGCGYNLKGLAITGRCPECSAPIERSAKRSVRVAQLDMLPEPTRRSLSVALFCMAPAMLVGATAFLLAGFESLRLVGASFALLAASASIVWAMAVWTATAADSFAAGLEWQILGEWAHDLPSARSLARWSQLAWTPAALLLAAAQLTNVLLGGLPPWTDLAAIVALPAVVGLIPTAAHLARFASDAYDDQTERNIRLLGFAAVPLLVTLPLGVLLRLGWLLAPFVGLSLMIGLVLLIMLSIAATGCFTLGMRFRRGISTSARVQRDVARLTHLHSELIVPTDDIPNDDLPFDPPPPPPARVAQPPVTFKPFGGHKVAGNATPAPVPIAPAKPGASNPPASTPAVPPPKAPPGTPPPKLPPKPAVKIEDLRARPGQ